MISDTPSFVFQPLLGFVSAFLGFDFQPFSAALICFFTDCTK